MTHFGDILTELLTEHPMTNEEIAAIIGCQPGNIYKLKKKPVADIKTIENVCRAFGVNPLLFFDADLSRNGVPDRKNVYSNRALLGKATMNIGLREEIKNLEEKLEEKERLIKEKERFIQFLLNSSDKKLE